MKDSDLKAKADKMRLSMDFDTSRKHFLIRSIAHVCWKTMLLYSIVDALLRIMTYHRSRILANIMKSAEEMTDDGWRNAYFYLVMWILFSFIEIARQHISRARNTWQGVIQLSVERKIKEKITQTPNSENIIGNTGMIHQHARRLFISIYMLMDSIGDICEQLFGLWVVSWKIGPRAAAIPIIISVVYLCLYQGVELLIDRFETRTKKVPELTKDQNHIIQGLHAIKFYSWETAFAESTTEFRTHNPPMLLRVLKYLVGLIGSSVSELSMVLTVVSYIDSGNTLTYVDTLELLPPIQTLTTVCSSMKSKIDYLRTMIKAEKHVEQIFCVDQPRVTQILEADGKHSVEAKDCIFSWGVGKFTLKDLNIQLEYGEFVTIVGRVGSGKSSLAMAIGGEMPLSSGNCLVYGTIGYVEQKPQLMNTTLRENILYGHPMDDHYYQRVIDACALRDDIDQLPAKDMTEIGNRGVNLSGGQKTRLALARAIYMRADIYILDDILSAVDANVERYLVENVLSANGILGNKTRILVTHAEHVVPLSNTVIVMSEGEATIIKQIPAEYLPSDPSTPVEFTTGSPQSMSESSDGRFSKNLILESTPFTWRTLSRYLAICGYMTLMAIAGIQYLHSYITYFLQSYRIQLLTDKKGGEFTIMLKKYLYMRMVVGISHYQLNELSMWARKSLLCNRISETFRKMTVDCVLHIPITVFDRIGMKDSVEFLILSRLQLSETIPEELCNKLKTILNAIFSLMQLIKTAPRMVFVIVPSVILKGVFECFCPDYSQMAICTEEVSTDISRIDAETENGLSVLRIHKTVEFLMEKWMSLKLHMLSITTSFCNASVFVMMTVEMLNTIVKFVGMLITLQYSQRTNTPISANELSAVFELIEHSLDKSSMLLEINYDTDAAKTTIRKFFAYLDQPRELSHRIEESQLPKDWPSKGCIEFKNYSMRYWDTLDPVLCNLSIKVRAHEKVGIVGRTGAGKSSLTYAIMRLVEPTSGTIFIDGIDISSIGLYDLRSRIGIIPQNPVLFMGTIRENLDPLNEFSDDQIWRVIERVQLTSIINKPTRIVDPSLDNDPDDIKWSPWLYKAGLDKWVEFRGHNFSVGQRQLLCLCRALLWCRQILILDEATANVDRKTDKIMQEVIQEDFKHCTILTIAHRLDTVMSSDKILVMDNGKVAEFGTPQDLLSHNSIFSDLVDSMRLSKDI